MSVPTIARVSELLNMVQDMIDRHEIAVTGSAVVAKSTSGQLRTLGTSDLRASYGEATELNDTLQLSPAQNAALARDLPADSFILVVMLSEQLADILVRQISRRTAAVVRRFDLETGLVAVPSTPVSR